jgi:hypothetical protein
VIETIIAQRMGQACQRQEDVLKAYDDLFKLIWHRVQPMLGRITVMAIMQRALVLTQERYPLVAHLYVAPEGVSFDRLRQRLEEQDQRALHETLSHLLGNFLDILTMLTGDILVPRLLQEMS